MKRLVVSLLIVSILFGFSGCKKHYDVQYDNALDLEDTLNCNYNNATAGNSKFWITDHSVYYGNNVLVSGGYYKADINGREKLVSLRRPVANQIIVCDDMYMLDCFGPGEFQLHCYDAEKGKDLPLGSVEDVWSYFPLGEHVYYLLNHHTDGESYGQPFGVCSVSDGTFTMIEEYVFAAGVMDDSPVYMTAEGENFEIFAYQAVSGSKEQIGSFTFPISEVEGVADFTNFTSSQVVLTVYGEGNAAKLLCYDISKGKTTVHELPGDEAGLVSSVIAYEDYAFAIREEDTTSDNGVYTSTIYRINLKTGETTTISTVKGSVNSFVTSDECIYTLSDENAKEIYRYDASGNGSLAFKL